MLVSPLESTPKSQISLADAFDKAPGTLLAGKRRAMQTVSGERVFFC